MLTYEWSDWRDGVFLWFQGCEYKSVDALTAMKTKLNEYAQSGQMKYKCCGVRLSSLKAMAEQNKELV